MKYILEDLKLEDYFDGKFVTFEVGYDKCEGRYFDYVIENLDLEAEEIMILDDKREDVDTASSRGIKAYFYRNINTLKSNIVI